MRLWSWNAAIVVIGIIVVVKVILPTIIRFCTIDGTGKTNQLAVFNENVVQYTIGANDHFLKAVPLPQKCLGANLYAMKNGGRTGNMMFELLGFYAIAKRVNRASAVYDSETNEKIREIAKLFPNVKEFFMDASSCGPLSFIDVPYKGCCTYDPNIINTILTYNTKHAITLKIFYLQSYKFFNNLSSDVIRRFFTPAHHVRVAINTLFSIRPKKNALNICVHIRRGDMINSTEALASDEKFSISALRYIHDKAREEDSRLPYTYVMSDDPEWAVSVFKVYDHLYVAVRGNRPPNTEWEFSRQYCDRVLLTASISTYGYWIGYLSRGQRVYYNYDFTHENGIEAQLVPTDFWPTHWIALRYNAVEDEVIEWSPDN